MKMSSDVHTHIPGGGDITHTLLMGEQLGWGHHTTLKEQAGTWISCEDLSVYKEKLYVKSE